MSVCQLCICSDQIDLYLRDHTWLRVCVRHCLEPRLWPLQTNDNPLGRCLWTHLTRLCTVKDRRCLLLSEYQTCHEATFYIITNVIVYSCLRVPWCVLRVCVHVTGVHFVLMGLDRSAGMCLITEQTGIRAPLTESHNHLVTDKMWRILVVFYQASVWGEIGKNIMILV